MDYAKVVRLPQYFRNLQRLAEIVSVLVRHGFGDLVDRLHLTSYLESGIRLVRRNVTPSERVAPDFGARLRRVCEDLGTVFIKFGQLIATRPDIFPDNITSEMRKLQDKVPPFPSDAALKLLEHDLEHPVSTLFSRFDEQPLAAASIAQVHRAALHDGTEVIVKIQRPHLDRIVETDLNILRGIAALVEEYMPESLTFSPSKLVEEFARTLWLECDFRREARAIERFAANFRDEPGLIVPTVFTNLTTKRVLVEQFIEGGKADDMRWVEAHGIDPVAVIRILTRVVLRSIFEHRFYHADPHPGNVLITPQGKVALIDYGAMGRMDATRLQQVLQFLVAVLSADTDRMLQLLREHQMAPLAVDEVGLKNQIADIIDLYLGQNLGALDVTQLLSEVFEVVRRYGITPPPDLLLVGKALTTVEYIGASLAPGYDPMADIKPYLLERYRQHLLDPHHYASLALQLSESYRLLIADLPLELRTIARGIARQQLSFSTAVKNFPEIKEHQARLVNRAIMAAIGLGLAALGVFLLTSPVHELAAVLLLGLAAFTLLRVWFAVLRSGGI